MQQQQSRQVGIAQELWQTILGQLSDGMLQIHLILGKGMQGSETSKVYIKP